MERCIRCQLLKLKMQFNKITLQLISVNNDPAQISGLRGEKKHLSTQTNILRAVDQERGKSRTQREGSLMRLMKRDESLVLRTS